MSSFKVLHIDTEKGWRGGQQQAVYLFEKMSENGYDTAMLCKKGYELEEYCYKKGLPHFAIRVRGELDIPAGYRISRICRKHNFNVLHLHTAHAMGLGLIAKFFMPSVILIGVRRVDFHIRSNYFSRRKYFSEKMNKIVCISKGIRNVLLQDGVDENKLVTIHSGVDLHKFDEVVVPADFRESLNIPADNVIVGTIAAFVGHKDYPNLIEAAEYVIRERKNVSFIAVGDGALKEQMEALINSKNLQKYFIFTGFRKDVGNFLKFFDIFVMASKLEGLGTSILDAQAQGLPVVGTNTGGIPEAVQNGINGVLVERQNSQALADGLIKLIDSPELRKQYGEEGMKTVEKFSRDYTYQKNLELYKTLVASK